jgi:hypothetical protein
MASPSWSGSVAASANSFGVSVTAGTACSWTAYASVSWVRFVVATGSGSAVATIAVDPNPGPARSTTVIVAGQSVSLTQLGSCSVTTAEPWISAPSNGAARTVRLTTSPKGCAWTAASSRAWLQVYPLAGAGDADLQYTV